MRPLLLAVALASCCLNSARAEEWVVEARYPDHAALARAAARFQHAIVDDKRGVLRVETDDAGMTRLRDAGLEVGIDVVASARLQSLQAQLQQAARRGDGLNSIPGFQCYRTVEETYQTMDELVAAHPDIAVIDVLGPSWKKTQNSAQGYDMRALRITRLATAATDPDRPRMVVFSSIHAREYAPAEINTRFAEWLIHGYGVDPEATWLVDHNDFRLILQANPDGRKQAEHQILWRKNADGVSGSCDGNPAVDADGDGIDLNRNFPFHWNIVPNDGGSSGDVCDETFRGPLKASEAETQNLFGYVAGSCNAAGECTGGVFADRRAGPMNPSGVGGDGGAAAPDDTSGMFFDIHSAASLVLWPWGDTRNAAPNRDGLRRLGRRLAWFNQYTPEQSDSLYPTDGATDDTMYGLLGMPAFTVETDGSFFQDCGSFESFTAPKNVEALRYAARSLHAPYKLPAGPDTIGVQVAPDLVPIGAPIFVSANLDGSRYNQSNGSEPVRAIAAASAYLDALPWNGTAQALTASDGAFDSPAETATGWLGSSGVAPGRHIVYVQGIDSAGNAGTPNAAFVDVAAPEQIATMTGTVTARADGTPIVATIASTDTSTGDRRSTMSEATDGHYTQFTRAGTVDLRVSAPGYLTEKVAGLALAGGSTTARDFQLLPNCSILDDDVESGAGHWTAQAPWTVVDNLAGHPGHAWSTPNYGDDLDRSLTSAAFDLTGYADITLEFDDRCATEAGYDFGFVEFSADGGSSWSTLYSCTGRNAWQSNRLELPASADGAGALKLRFRLQSDGGVNAAGWAVDDIRLEAGGDACRASQQPDTIFSNGFDGV